MKIKITQFQIIKLFKNMLFALFFMASIQGVIGQNVTGVFPTRITTNSTVTIIGSGFTSTTTISIPGISIVSGSKILVSGTEMTFSISASGNNDISGVLQVGGLATGFSLDYISPIHKILENGESSNVKKVTEIFTTYNGFWRSSQWKSDPTNIEQMPNTSHDLLAFTYNGVTYSTGVDDALLSANGVVFNSQLFYAYSTNGLDGVTYNNNYLAMADMIDGELNEGTEITSPEILDANIYEVLIDGVNGLDLGTGVTNFNQLADVEFYSSGGQLGALDDKAPDFLITQIAQAGSTDVYYYTDNFGNVVGRPIKLTIRENDDPEGDALLAYWRLDLYTFVPGINYGLAVPKERALTSNEVRPIRMAAFTFEDFQINEANVADINNINMVAGGTADLAFLAYNRGSFNIKTPVFNTYPVSKYVCEVPSTDAVTFTGTAEVSGGNTGTPEEAITFQWYKFNEIIPGATSNSYTIPGDIGMSSFGTYKLKATNSFGSVIVPTKLIQGGIPVYWDGTKWSFPPSFANTGITVKPEDRRFVFSSDYNEVADLVGCDCLVPFGSDATIPSGSVLKLIGNVTVETGGSLTFEDSSSLIQINDVSNENTNRGNIIMQRNATGTSDFIIWSTPVKDYNITNLSSPYTSNAYSWDVKKGTLGDWTFTSGLMSNAVGYAVHVPSNYQTSGFTANFGGTPLNGTISVDVLKTSDASALAELKNWNILGNPYPSAISADEFLAKNTLLNGNIRLYANNLEISNVASALSGAPYQNLVYDYNEQYISYNATGANPPQTTIGNISSGQGFYVQLAEGAAEGKAVFTNDIRYDEDGMAYDNSHFFKTNVTATDNDDKQLIWLSLIDDSNASASALIGYVQGATLGKDKMYDAYSDMQSLDLYTTVEDSKMVIQGRPLPFSDSDFIPLGANLPADGSYKIAIGDLKGSEFMDNARGIYLEDTYLNLEHDLRSSPYEFSGEQGDIKDRFILRFEQTLSIDDTVASSTYVNIINDVLNVKSLKNIKAVNVFDISGKKVISFKPNGQSNQLSESFKFSKGIYLTSVVLEGNVVVTKKVIN
ncbi:hypothetical protein ACFFVB_02495 [Formosa undariae]|uniref:T9SS type A sorting domain-containing protein n=1 Tax=Formosa undariae TaxID=1325436 RepID=A0ABV5EXN0_9FLAO